MKNFYFRIPATLICCNVQTRRRRRRRVIIIFLQSFMTWSQSRRFDWNTADTSSEMQRTQPNECEVMDVVLFFPSVTAAAISVASKKKMENWNLFSSVSCFVSFDGTRDELCLIPPLPSVYQSIPHPCVCDNHNRTRQLVSTYRPAQSLSLRKDAACMYFFSFHFNNRRRKWKYNINVHLNCFFDSIPISIISLMDWCCCLCRWSLMMAHGLSPTDV